MQHTHWKTKRSLFGFLWVFTSIISLFNLGPTWAQEQYYTLSSAGDRGVVELEINNPSTFEKQATFGPHQGQDREREPAPAEPGGSGLDQAALRHH